MTTPRNDDPPPPAPGIRWCENHRGWEWRWIDREGRIVWHPVPDVPQDRGALPAVLATAAAIYRCDPSSIENYADQPGEAFGMCAPYNDEEMRP